MTTTMDDYRRFIEDRTQLSRNHGFEPTFLPDTLKPFQRVLCEWAIRKGRGALLVDTGLGKGLMELVWAQNVVEHTNKPVLHLSPLSVAAQMVREAAKFGIEVERSKDGKWSGKPTIVVANYDRLHLFDRTKFVGVCGDEGSVLKNDEGVLTAIVTEFMRLMPYRLLASATASPNDHAELGTQSECLGELGYMDMLLKFFKSDDGSLHPFRTFAGGRSKAGAKWNFRPHAEEHFWRWVCSWARACRKPSDLGSEFDDTEFILPEHQVNYHVVEASRVKPGFIFEIPAKGLREQREEQRRTLEDRCKKVADLLNHDRSGLAWCHSNSEGDLITKMVKGAVQVSGKDSDDRKEEIFEAFISGQIRVLVTKPRIAGVGLNFQHCAHQTYFPSHSFEQYYQSLRRLWRFGQTEKVRTDLVTTEGGAKIMENLGRKEVQAERQFAELIRLMNHGLQIDRASYGTKPVELPTWLS